MFIHLYIYANEHTYTYIYMCRCIIYIYTRRREREICLKSSLFEQGVGVYLHCVCSCTHTHTHTACGLIKFEPRGRDETHEELAHEELQEAGSDKSREYMYTKYTNKHFFSSKKANKKISRRYRDLECSWI